MNVLVKHVRGLEAFTLLELLVTVAIFAIVLAAINTVFFSALRLRNRSTAAIQATQPGERALDVLKKDFGGIMQTGIIVGAFSSDTMVQGISQPISVEFYTTTGFVSDDYPWSEVQRIDYWLQPPTNNFGPGGRDLIRGVTRNLLAPIVQPPELHPLLQGVQNLKFSYFDGTNWMDTWDAMLNYSNAPVALKMKLDFVAPRSGQAAPPSLQLVVPIVTQLRTNNATITTTSSSGGGGGGGGTGGGGTGGGGTGGGGGSGSGGRGGGR